MNARSTLLAAVLLAATAGVLAYAPRAAAQDPGIAIPATSEASDVKQGAVLVYNYYTSDQFNPVVSDTRIAITNGDAVNPQRVRVFFVDGSSGAVSNEVRCLGANQTISFQTQTVDPGVSGYIVVVAVNPTTGCPIGSEANVLSGFANVRRADGLRGTLPAVAVSALYAGTLAGCSGASSSANLNFDAISYNRLQRVSSIDNMPSRGDGKSTLLVVNRMGGNLATSLGTLGKLAGTMFDDAENKKGWVMLAPSAQFTAEIKNGTPVIPPPVETFIPAGRTGWSRLRAYSGDLAILGAAFFTGPFGSMNLRTSTTSGTSTLNMPVSPPSC